MITNCKKIRVYAILLILFLTFLSCSGPKVVVASKPHSEQYILAEMISMMIETHSDIKVDKRLGIGGGTSNIHPAVISGKIDIYPEYTGTGWLFVLKENLIKNPDKLYESVKDEYLKRFNIVWLDRYGFNNTYTLALKNKKAVSSGIETYSDLASKSESLIFGAEYDFYEREDGYPGLKKLYNLEFRKKVELDIGLKYQAIDSKEVDVINAFSTDGLLKHYDLKVLKDDKTFFPSYQAATIIRKDSLLKYPELEVILNKLSGQISDNEMMELNYKVEKENLDPEKVAKDYLELKGLI